VYPIELFVSDVLDRFLVLLIGGVIDEDIQPPKHFDRAIDCFGAESWILHIARDSQRDFVVARALLGYGGKSRAGIYCLPRPPL